MPDYSAHYNLTMLDIGDEFSVNNGAFLNRNISNLDQKVYLGAEGHHHDGESAVDYDPTAGPSLVLVPGSGSIPGGRTIRYRYTLVDTHGQETAASPEATITTPAPVIAPGTPTVVRSTGGILLPGNYFYVLTAYKDANSLETTAGPRAYTSLTFSSGEKTITLDLPSVPAGADGFNVYRRSPGSTRFQWLDSIAMNVATPPTEYVDDGSIAEDCNRTVPHRNTTATTNSVLVSLPGATPSLPDGFTWKIYRTYVSGDYDSSLLHHVVEETSEGSGIIEISYSDVGASTLNSKFPAFTEIAGSPTKVLLTDMAEVQGTVPIGTQVVPMLLTFTYPGAVAVATGEIIWICDFDKAQIVKTRASLGRDSTPAVQNVIADVVKYEALAPAWTTIYSDSGSRPTVPVGDMIGPQYTLVADDTQLLLNGDALTVDLVQGGGGATPTDENLVVSILLYVQVGSLTTSHVWATS